MIRVLFILLLSYANLVFGHESYFKPAIGEVEIGQRDDALTTASGNEIVVSGYDGRLFVWKNDKTLLSDIWPMRFTEGYVATSPYLYDVDNEHEMEIAVVVQADDGKNYLHIVDKAGQEAPGFPLNLLDSNGNPIDVISTPVLAEIDNIPADGFEMLISSADNKIYLLHCDGTIMQNWPITVSGKAYPVA